VYCLELAGEDDAFAAYEAASAATGVELVAPGVATARAVSPAAVRRLAYAWSAGELVGRTDAAVDAAVALLEAAGIDRTGTMAVRARNVRGTADVSTAAAERELGAVLVDRGFAVDLDDPDHVLRALFAAGPVAEHDAVAGADGGERSVAALAWVSAEAAREFAPKPTDRPFFQPGSMAPDDARACVNLAGAAPGRTLLDPMCGTGGLLVEGGLVGARLVGTDAQSKMARGARENLTAYVGADAPPAARVPFDVARGDATALPLRDDAVDAVAFDAPYGRQSKIATHELDDLVAGALAEAARVAPRCVVVADRPWTGAAREAGWSVAATFARRVHRSLTRHVHVLDRAP